MKQIPRELLEGPWKQQKHIDFVDGMYARFGFEKHPGYAIVETQPLLSAGGFSPPNHIIINDTHDAITFEHAVLHESVHFLHPYARKFWHEKPRSEANQKIQSLCELVAHFGAMIYIREQQGTAGVEKYGEGHTEYPEFLAAHDIIDHPELLQELSNISPEEANVLIARYTQHRITYDW